MIDNVDISVRQLSRGHPCLLIESMSTVGRYKIYDGDGKDPNVHETPVPFSRREIFSWSYAVRRQLFVKSWSRENKKGKIMNGHLGLPYMTDYFWCFKKKNQHYILGTFCPSDEPNFIFDLKFVCRFCFKVYVHHVYNFLFSPANVIYFVVVWNNYSELLLNFTLYLVAFIG